MRFIRMAAENLTELVDDLLDLAKVEAGKTVVAPSPFTAASLFGALRGMLRPLLVGDAVALLFDEPEDVPPLSTPTRRRFRRSCAISFPTRSSSLNAARCGYGRPRTRRPTPSAFHVRDTGIGIAPADVELIFQEFGQVAHRLQGRVKGHRA